MWILTPPEKPFFAADERAVVAALFDALLPIDPLRKAPGAADADAVEFLDRLLAMPDETYYELPTWRQLYRAALPAIEAASRALFAGAGVAALQPAQREQLLKGLEAGTLSPWSGSADQKAVFKALRDHCIQGCFADPRWGGNRDRIMWRHYGYVMPAES